MQTRISLVAMALTAAMASGCSSDGSGGSPTGSGPGGDLGTKLKTVDNSEAFYSELRGALLQQAQNPRLQMLRVEVIAPSRAMRSRQRPFKKRVLMNRIK